MTRLGFIALSALSISTPAHAHQFVAFFDYGGAELSQNGYRMVRDAAAYILRDKPSRVVINAHMDTAEAAAFSDELSHMRAQVIATELVALGVDPSVIERNGHGAVEPAKNTPANTREPLNRRAVVDYFP